MIIFVLKKLHETQGSLSKFHELTIYIYIERERDCFIVTQLFSVARHAKCFKLGSKPG